MRHSNSRILSVSLLVSIFALVVCAAASAQKRPQPPSNDAKAELVSLKESATLEETLSWLNETLLRYGKFTRRLPGELTSEQPAQSIRYNFLGLEAEGCSVTYRVRTKHIGTGGGGGGGGASADIQSANEYVRQPNGDIAYKPKFWKPSSGGGSGSDVVERVVDLKALDPAQVVAITPKRVKGAAVSFITGNGTTAVRGVDWSGKPVEFDGDELYVNDRAHVEAIADALRRAVTLCKK